MAIEIVDSPIKNEWIFHGYVSLPEGNTFGLEVLIVVKPRLAWVGWKIYTKPFFVVFTGKIRGKARRYPPKGTPG